MTDARVVYERDDNFDMHAGPFGFERVGFCIGNRVFWTGLSGSYVQTKTWDSDKALAEKIVRLWNEAKDP